MLAHTEAMLQHIPRPVPELATPMLQLLCACIYAMLFDSRSSTQLTAASKGLTLLLCDWCFSDTSSPWVQGSSLFSQRGPTTRCSSESGTCDIVSCHFKVDASWNGAQLLMHIEEGFNLSPDVLVTAVR